MIPTTKLIFLGIKYLSINQSADKYKVVISKKENVKAHNAQSDLLFAEANGNKVEVGILLVHAQDHLMTSMLAIELIQELIVLHRDKAGREK